MTSPAYQACVDILERWLSPRVVSRTLRMAMQPAGLTPDTVTASDLEPILKEAVFKQLQVAMPPERARELVQEILVELAARERPAEDASEAGEAEEAPRDAARPEGEAEGKEATAAQTAERAREVPEHTELTRLREAMRPFNLYFAWPEVRRLRAQLQRIEDELARGGDPAGLIEEADDQLTSVHQKLEDTLVLQARDLAGLEEAFEEVRGLGGAKVRRLDNLLRHVREAQASRQLADAEIERARRVTFELRKLMASSVYQDEREGGDGGLEARLQALELEAESQELAALARERSVLLEHREDLAERVREAQARIEGGQAPEGGIEGLRETLRGAEADRILELTRELDAAETSLNERPEVDDDEIRGELALLRETLENGLPRVAYLLRFRDLLDLALRRARQEGERAELDATEARRRLSAQGDLLSRSRQDLLRYGPDSEGPLLDRYREAVEALRSAQAEERLDPDAARHVREAGDALAAHAAEGDTATSVQLQVRSLLSKLDGLPRILDPDGASALQRELEPWLEAPPSEEQLVAGAASVADLVDRCRADARAKLERIGDEAAQWSLGDVLEVVRAANERLEDDGDPGLSAVERQLSEAREAARARQVERLHAFERDAERLAGIDDAHEAALGGALADARQRLEAGASAASALDRAANADEALEATLRTRLQGFMPRLDAALTSFRSVERLNSEDVATVRRILTHLDAQRGSFARVSPGLRARLERSLQEAEDLLGKLEEEERATRAIADRLMAGGEFTDVLGLFGPREREGEAAEADTASPGDAGEPADAAHAWVARHGRRDGVASAALLAPGRGVVASHGLPATGEAGPDVSDTTGRLLHAVSDLGASLDLGRPRIVTLEGPTRTVLLGTSPDATALLATPDPAALGLLVRELRQEGPWRDAVRGAGEADAQNGEDAAGPS